MGFPINRVQYLKFLFWIRRRVLGFKAGSESGSNLRRSFSRLAMLGTILLVIQYFIFDGYFEENHKLHAVMSFYFLILSLVFFITNILGVVFSASEEFIVNQLRLFLDVVLSACLHIVVFSYVFRTFRIQDSNDNLIQTPNYLDHLYFSIVTFTTLGYGDMKPSGSSRIFAAYEALLGNLHLGFIVAAAFLAASPAFTNKK